MKKKIISILMIMIVLVAIIINQLIAYATVATTPLYVNLTTTDTNNVGYAISNPTGEVSGQAPYIWNIMSYNSKNASDISAKQRNLYCVKADYGQTWFTQEKEEEILEYNLVYDMQADRQNLLNNLKDNSNTADDVVKSLLTPEGGQYEQLLWVLDHSYTAGNNIDKYLETVGILKYDEDKYYDENTMQVLGNESLTSEDIVAIQKMVIWYFTNGSENELYDKTEDNENLWLNITTDGTTYNALSNISQSRNNLAMYLYKYLITNAKNNASKYNANNNYKIDSSAPVSVNTTNLKQENGKYVIETKRNGSNYLIGPIVIEEKSSLKYDIEMQVKDQDNKPLNQGTDYIYTNANGETLENIKTQKDLVGITGGFYISVSRSLIENVNISVDISYNVTSKKLWLQGKEDENGILLNAEQPLVEITQEPQETTVELTSKPEEFDLALRKYITGLQDKNGTNKTISNTRNLNNISLDTLLTGTTATYKHRKDPVIVEDKDEVTYTIRIYNEGNHDGYASKIIDQLPKGLVNSTNNGTTIVSKDKNGNNKNTYKLSYNSSSNQIILEIDNTTSATVKDIEAYEKDELDYETIEIKCMVAQEADTEEQIILTNVAYIAKAYDSEKKVEILTKEQDRDSEPQTTPNVNKDNMENYIGNASNKADLTDNEYFYEGQQDDDDFEKLVIMPVKKVFDLALFKHIAAISKDQIIENGEYVTDTGNIDGTYLRAPVVRAIDPETGKITYEQDDKEALIVEPGDYVLYTIRVYNEGEIDGYASKIKDALPIGLEFVYENEEYNGIWEMEEQPDEDGRQVVTTTWYAKGQGAEAGTVEGNANYKANLLKALNKEAEISDENPDYIDAQVLCRVVEDATSDRVLVNYAQISDDSDENGDPIDDVDSTPDEWIDGEDDQDIERIKVQCFDLSLRKYISSVNGIAPETSREPVVNVSNLVNKTGTTAVYEHTKAPLSVQIGDKVVYTIRVYNEGDINGFASEIKDYLPPYLTYVKESEINKQYGWEISDDGRIVTTKYLSDTELKAFNGTKLDYADVKIECLVSENAPLKETQTNIAEISEYTYNGKTVDKDIDSTSNNIKNKIPDDKNLPSYKDEEISKNYVPGYEDDDDFEKIYIREFDLALRKFITQIQDNEVTTRIPQVKIENGVISYEHSKDPITVHVADRIVYTLRIYNEGEINGYASEISDDIPEYLEYLPEDSTNVDYMWKMYDENGKETEKVENAVKIKTTYLSKDNGEDNLIKAYDGETLSYKEIKIAFKVKDPNSNQYIITNYAQISDDTDEAGNQIKDKDSETDVWNDGEDDQDIENIKVEYFDLALVKFVSKVIVIENGKETVTETGYNGHEDPEPIVKVELHKKKLDQVVVKFGYGITVTNEGDIPGYATELTDYVPEGLKFVAEDNPNWTDEGNNVISTRQLENTLLQPGESATVEVIFTWINGADNLALKTNVVEISEDKNEYDVPDRDSTPDNKVEGEDDIDIAKVILTITTGATKTYLGLTIGLLAVIATGIVLIKKFVI